MPLVDKKTTNQMLESTCLLGGIKIITAGRSGS